MTTSTKKIKYINIYIFPWMKSAQIPCQGPNVFTKAQNSFAFYIGPIVSVWKPVFSNACGLPFIAELFGAHPPPRVSNVPL